MSYYLYLNGKLYGTGPLDYINALIRDYVVVSELYGHNTVTFTIKKEDG